jgi:hypothetical protein
MYLGGSIMTFALPYAAFIVIATVLFFLYRRPHHGPRLKYLASGPLFASVQTREPGPVPAPAAKAAEPAAASGTQATGAAAADTATAEEPADSDSSASEGKE